MAKERKQLVIASCRNKHLPLPAYLSCSQQLRSGADVKLLTTSFESSCDFWINAGLQGGMEVGYWLMDAPQGCLLTRRHFSQGWTSSASCWEGELATLFPAGTLSA